MGGGGSFTPNFDHYRFYDDDAGEAASTALTVGEDTDITVDVDGGNVAFQLRAMVDEQGGKDGKAADDWQIQYNKNGVEWLDLTTTDGGDGIHAVAAGLTNDAASTNRAVDGVTDGGGSFDAGEQSSDGLVDDSLLTANNFTEHVYGVEIVAANVADTDAFDFQFSSPSGIVNNVVPTATVSKSAAAVTGTGWSMGGGWS